MLPEDHDFGNLTTIATRNQIPLLFPIQSQPPPNQSQPRVTKRTINQHSPPEYQQHRRPRTEQEETILDTIYVAPYI